MLPSRDFGVCRVKVGLLILRDCKEPAVAECCRCGRAVCGLHQVLRPQFTYCPECAAQVEQSGQDPNAVPAAPVPPTAGALPDANLERVRQRQEYYRDYGYCPYYYGHHYYFSDSDYHVFGEKGHVVRHEPPASSEPSGSFQASESAEENLDDALES
jgi:hypothetical protein